MVRDEVLLITTQDEAESTHETHVYDISAFADNQADSEELKAALLATVRPDSWNEAGTGDGSAMLLKDDSLIVNQSQSVHEEIHQFFEQLRRGVERREQ
jgi:hypothetical protein